MSAQLSETQLTVYHPCQLQEHLHAYHAEWLTSANIHGSESETANLRNPLDERLRDKKRSDEAPPVPSTKPTPLHPTAGLLPIPEEDPIPSSSRDTAPVPPTARPTTFLPHKRPAPQDPTVQDGPSKAPRAPRTCMKCGTQTCPGRGGRKYCNLPCQDCGAQHCDGRRSKDPKTRCPNSASTSQ